MECSWNDGSKTQYYIVILDQLQSHSRELVRALESRVRDPLTGSSSSLKITLFLSSTLTPSYQTSAISSFKVSMFIGQCLIWCWHGRTMSALCSWNLITTVVMFAPLWRSSVSFYLRTLSLRYSRFTVLVQSSLIQMTMLLLPTTFVNPFTFLV